MDNEEREIRGIVPGFFVPFVPTDERRCLCRSDGDILLILKNRKLDSILSSEVNYIYYNFVGNFIFESLQRNYSLIDNN